MIDVRKETLVGFSQGHLLPRRVCYTTLRRWARGYTVRRSGKVMGVVRLEFIHHGRENVTSIEAYERFLRRIAKMRGD